VAKNSLVGDWAARRRRKKGKDLEPPGAGSTWESFIIVGGENRLDRKGERKQPAPR